VPFGITSAAFVIAAYAHPHHARYWLPVAGITVTVTVVMGIPHQLLWSRPAGKVTAGALARLWEKCGIDRGIERAYAATVIAVTGGWLAAAIAIGPAVKPLSAIAGIATVILGIPCVHSRGVVNWRQAAAGSGGSQGFPESALRMASRAVMPWAAAESR